MITVLTHLRCLLFFCFLFFVSFLLTQLDQFLAAVYPLKPPIGQAPLTAASSFAIPLISLCSASFLAPSRSYRRRDVSIRFIRSASFARLPSGRVLPGWQPTRHCSSDTGKKLWRSMPNQLPQQTVDLGSRDKPDCSAAVATNSGDLKGTPPLRRLCRRGTGGFLRFLSLGRTHGALHIESVLGTEGQHTAVERCPA